MRKYEPLKQGGRKMILGGGAPFKLKIPPILLTQSSEITVSG